MWTNAVPEQNFQLNADSRQNSIYSKPKMHKCWKSWKDKMHFYPYPVVPRNAMMIKLFYFLLKPIRYVSRYSIRSPCSLALNLLCFSIAYHLSFNHQLYGPKRMLAFSRKQLTKIFFSAALSYSSAPLPPVSKYNWTNPQYERAGRVTDLQYGRGEGKGKFLEIIIWVLCTLGCVISEPICATHEKKPEKGGGPQTTHSCRKFLEQVSLRRRNFLMSSQRVLNDLY